MNTYMANVPLMEKLLAGDMPLSQGAEHGDWRVRYAAAVAMGESGDAAWLPTLQALIRREEGRELYSQPRVEGYRNSYDDTRMAEQLEPIEVIWDKPYSEEIKDDWRCRGRVLQACLFAIAAIGRADQGVLDTLHQLLSHGDSLVKAGAARALIHVGTKESLPHLEAALMVDEWCLQTEAKKAIRRIKDGENP